MATDDERREAARRLRECRSGWSSGECYYTIIHALGLSDTSREDGGAALYAHLADLIEPGDMSQSCRDTVACGIDSIYDWCFERLEGADGAEDELYCSIMSAIEEYRHPERVTARTARPVDRDALLALADMLASTSDTDCRGCRLEGAGCAECSSGVAHEAARRIRKACGEARDE